MKCCLYIILCLTLVIAQESDTNTYLFINDPNTKIDSTTYHGRSKEFYRYARNEIFARKGYTFNDPELALYFSMQSWYQESDVSTISYSEIEKHNIDLLKKLEEEAVHHPRRFTPLNNVLVTAIKRQSADGYFIIELFILNEKYLWVQKSTTIPSEYLSSIGISLWEFVEDASSYSIVNIDKGYENDLGHEIEIHYEDPLDEEHTENWRYIGLLPSGDYGTYIATNRQITQVEKLTNHSFIFANTSTICHNPYEVKRVFNTIDKACYTIPTIYANVEKRFTRLRKSVALYYDEVSSVKNNGNAIIDTIPHNYQISVQRHYISDRGNAVEVRYNGKTGWICEDEYIQYCEVCGVD